MFEKLKAFVGDNAEALALIATLEGTTSSNVERINTLETENAAVKETRDKYKNGNSLVKSILGVDAINEDTLKEALKGLKTGKDDSKFQAEIESLKKLIEDSKNELGNTKTEYEGKLQSMALENALANAGLGANVANEEVYPIVAGLVKDGAVFENDQIVYKKPDGSTIYGDDKEPMSIQKRMEALKANPNYAGLFGVDVNPGSGTPTKQGGVIITGSQDLTPNQKMEAGRQQTK